MKSVKLLRKLRQVKWFVRSDFDLMICFHEDTKKINGFYFYTKKPFSSRYQEHNELGLENISGILDSIREGIKSRRDVYVMLPGDKCERVKIWKGSLKRAERQLLLMTKMIQQQYG